MKKTIFLLLGFILLFSVSAVFAADETTESELSLISVGSLFEWGSSVEDVKSILNGYDGLECEYSEDEELGKNYYCEASFDDETDSYEFYFTDDEILYEILATAILPEGADYQAVMQLVAKTYGLDKADPYTSEVVEDFIKSHTDVLSVAGDSTIGIIAGDPETDETYATVGMMFLSKEWAEN